MPKIMVQEEPRSIGKNQKYVKTKGCTGIHAIHMNIQGIIGGKIFKQLQTKKQDLGIVINS
jgi:uncharacterized protein YukJ